jgi:5-formyltetrahydrofolate cyclo-ligase
MLLKPVGEVYKLLPTSKGSLVKKELRRRLQAVLSSIPPAVLVERSRLAASLLFNEPEYRRAEIMMVYLSHKQEADTTRIVLQAWQDHKRVLAPQVSWESKAMIPIEISNLDEDVGRNEMGLREPVKGPPIPIELIDLVVVPGLAFDGTGSRLGRGRGFYDRFLARSEFRGVACGFALESQMVEVIPARPHDMKIDMLVTDVAVRRFPGRKAAGGTSRNLSRSTGPTAGD